MCCGGRHGIIAALPGKLYSEGGYKVRVIRRLRSDIMRLVEVSYVLSSGTPKWPTNPDERLEYILTLEKDGCNASSAYHHMHNGTHVDAPAHFGRGGKTIDEIPVDDFYYENPLVLSLPEGHKGKIGAGFLEQSKEKIESADLLVIHTGASGRREADPQGYIKDYPTLTEEAARYLRSGFPALKGIAFDVIGVDDSATGANEGFPVHHALLDPSEDLRTLLVFEDVDTQKIMEVKDDIVAVAAFPVRWKNAEAAPVAMVAICR
jgi:kynurenine formamidase